MKKVVTTSLGLLVAVPFLASAASFNITVPDGVTGGSSSWHTSTTEDNETEPGTEIGQKWDLEALVYNQSAQSLTVVGGFNFSAGAEGAGRTFNAGDIFINVSGAVAPGTNPGSNGYHAQKNVFGYDYVVAFDDRTFVSKDEGALTSLSYEVFALTANSDLVSVYFDQLSFSNPWIYDHPDHNLGLVKDADGNNVPNQNSDGSEIEPETDGTAEQSYYSDNDAVNLAFAGAENWDDLSGDGPGGNNVHYALTLDISWLVELHGGKLSDILLTIGCGNDMIAGQFTPTSVPEGGATAILLAAGCLGLVLIRRHSDGRSSRNQRG